VWRFTKMDEKLFVLGKKKSNLVFWLVGFLVVWLCGEPEKITNCKLINRKG